MTINRLTMHNFGIYAGTNIFEFTHEKPIVLIGGMNGRGKTTFLEAILLSLYGANSITYKESKYHSYNQYLRSYVNKSNNCESCFIELAFAMNESTQDAYVVRREWNALSKITKEAIHVQRNGEYSEFLTKNWAMFVENILPSALSGFFFFDGEKIAELAVSNTDDQLKESIRSMLGITVLDVLKNDLRRSIRRIGKKSGSDESGDQLENLRQARDDAAAELEEVNHHVEDASLKVHNIQKTIDQLRKKYELKGGAVVEQRQNLMQKRVKIQADMVQNEEMLVNMAATALPMLLLKDLISKIKLQAEDEHDDFVMQQALRQMDRYLSAYEEINQKSVGGSHEFIEFVRRQTRAEAVEQVYEMSEHALFQINELLESILQSDADSTKKLLEQKVVLKKQLDDAVSYLALDIDEKQLVKIYDQIKKKESELIQAQVEESRRLQEKSSIQAVVVSKTAEFNREVEAYLERVELADDRDRMMKYSNMAIKIVDAYVIELQKRKIGLLGETITECYRKLANKKKLIQKIIMDSETLEIRYLDENEDEVLKDSLSAGEKQLVVIAILWALALCSKKKLPVIIDTPLSRLDSKHRESIITTYFPNASGQTIILSTDTEIDHNYYGMIKENLGDEFTLVYSEETKSTSIRKGYF